MSDIIDNLKVYDKMDHYKDFKKRDEEGYMSDIMQEFKEKFMNGKQALTEEDYDAIEAWLPGAVIDDKIAMLEQIEHEHCVTTKSAEVIIREHLAILKAEKEKL